MAVTYGFYDSLNHDRLYNAQQMSAIFDGIINDGVFMSVGNQFHTVAGTGMQVIVKSGRAWFDSTWTLNDAEYPLSIDAADVLLTRIDAVVLEVNSEVATRANTIKIVKGIPASTPAKPTLTNTATIHQHALAYVTVAKNITAITNSMIEIVVGKTETPYVTAILQTTDITDLYNQWEDYFQTWFDTVRGTLDGDVALNLQNQITSLRRETLKNTTPPIIGLPSSATPDDMFQALAKTGDLHVWRKTVTLSEGKPAVQAGYTLGSVTSIDIFKNARPTQSFKCYWKIADSVSVDKDGNVALVSPVEKSLYYNQGDTLVNAFRGKFTQYSRTESGGLLNDKNIYWIPQDASIGFLDDSGIYRVYLSAQLVSGHPYIPEIPAGTTTTYPVSTNPNAYQEGDDAKPAGYVLGDVVTGSFLMGASVPVATNDFYYTDAPTVSDNGVVSVPTENTPKISVGYKTSFDASTLNVLRGKFVFCSGDGRCDPIFYSVIYVPSDAVFTKADWDSGLGYRYYLDKYQPVTGYAAIPAGTTIEYLGKLGNKAKVQVVSYVGTGTYGENNPCSISVNFPMKAIVFLARFYTNDEKKKISKYFVNPNYYNDVSSILVEEVPKTYSPSLGLGNNEFSNNFGKRSKDRKSYYWYNTNNESDQGNSAGVIYYFLVIG